MNLLPSTLIFLPSLLVAVPMPLDQEGSTYIRGYNYKVSDAPIDQSIYESHENHLQIPRSDGSRINFSRYYDSPGLPQHVAPPLDAVVVEAKVFVKVVTYICQSCNIYLSKLLHVFVQGARETRQGGRLPLLRCQRQHQLPRLFNAWLCLRDLQIFPLM